MLNKILEKIDSLPPLPQTIEKIEAFRKKENKTIEELIHILEQDALVVTTLLKIANSSFYGFKTKVETTSRVINLLGMNFTIYVAINETITNLLQTDLKPYNISSEDFMEASNGALFLANTWLSKLNIKFKEELLLAAMLQETGKFILSELIINRNISDEFKKKIEQGNDVAQVEKELLEITTSQITAKIFKHWGLNEDLIDCIKNVDDIEKCDDEYKFRAQILDVIKTVCNPCLYLSERNIESAMKKAQKYGMDLDLLTESINTLREKGEKDD